MKSNTSLVTFFLAAIFVFAGCSIKTVEVKTLTIPPQKQPVTITATGTAVCHDYFLFYRVTEVLDVKSSNGQVATRVGQE